MFLFHSCSVGGMLDLISYLAQHTSLLLKSPRHILICPGACDWKLVTSWEVLSAWSAWLWPCSDRVYKAAAPSRHHRRLLQLHTRTPEHSHKTPTWRWELSWTLLRGLLEWTMKGQARLCRKCCWRQQIWVLSVGGSSESWSTVSGGG